MSILDAIISKNIPNETKQKELREMIDMRQYRDEMEKILYEEFGDVLCEKDRIIEEKERKLRALRKEERRLEKEERRLKKENETMQKYIEYRNKIQQLNKIENLPPEARKIIDSMMQL